MYWKTVTENCQHTYIHALQCQTAATEVVVNTQNLCNPEPVCDVLSGRCILAWYAACATNVLHGAHPGTCYDQKEEILSPKPMLQELERSAQGVEAHA